MQEQQGRDDVRTGPEGSERSGDPGGAVRRPQRWSAKKKGDVVLRILRGESMELLSRELGVAMHDLQEWHDSFVSAGAAALRSRLTTAAEVELKKAQAKIGELTMELELHEKKRALLPPRRRSGS